MATPMASNVVTAGASCTDDLPALQALRDECTTLAGLLYLDRGGAHNAALAHAMGRLHVRLNFAFQIVGRPPSSAAADESAHAQAGRAALLQALTEEEHKGKRPVAKPARDTKALEQLLAQLRESEALVASLLPDPGAAPTPALKVSPPVGASSTPAVTVQWGQYGPRRKGAAVAEVERAVFDARDALQAANASRARVLAVFAAYHPGTLTREQAAGIAGMAVRGGGFGTVWRDLRVGGLVEEPERGQYRATRAGLAELGDKRPRVPRTPSERVELWGRQLGDGGRRMLEALSAAGDRGLPRLELASRAGFAPRGGAFGKELRLLTRGNLVAVRGRRYVLHAWLLHGPSVATGASS